MTIFDPYLLTQYDSEAIDELLGFDVQRIEAGLLKRAKECLPMGDMKTWGAAIHQGNQTWVGLSLSTLQTPYPELLHMCEYLKPNPRSHFVDLGAGYGRLAVVLHYRDPSLVFTGYEFVKERVHEGSMRLLELGIKNAKLLEKDLTDANFELPEADYYFIYDYGKVSHIRSTLKQLETIADRKKFRVIARGKGARSLIENEHPWLSQVHPPYHTENFSIYSMALEDNPSQAGPGDPEPF